MRLEFPAHGYKSGSERANTRIRQPINRSQVRQWTCKYSYKTANQPFTSQAVNVQTLV